MPKQLEAMVEKIFPAVTKKTKTWEDFTTQKVLVSWDNDEEFPSKLVLEQWWQKKIDVVKSLEEGKTYLFDLNFRANVWTDPNGNETAFWSISAWRAQPMENAVSHQDDNSLPF